MALRFFSSLVCHGCTIWADISKSSYRPQTSSPNDVEVCMRCIHATSTLFLRCPELGYLAVLSRHNSFAGAVTAGAASVVFLETQVCIGLCAKRLEGFDNQLRFGNYRATIYSISYMFHVYHTVYCTCIYYLDTNFLFVDICSYFEFGCQKRCLGPMASVPEAELQMRRCLGLGRPDPVVELC